MRLPTVSVASVLALGLVASIPGMGLAGCSSFGAEDPPAGEAGAGESGAPVDAAAPTIPEAGVADAGVADAVATGTCVDLRAGVGDFKMVATGGGLVTSVGGLTVTYPAASPGGMPEASWYREITPPVNTTKAKITIDGVVTVGTAALNPSNWHAGIFGLAYGAPLIGATAPSVHVALVAAQSGGSDVELGVFLDGLPNATLQEPVGPSGVGHTATAVHGTLEVVWSAAAGSATATYGAEGMAAIHVTAKGATAKGPTPRSWELILGGVAAGQPDVSITFKSYCIAFE